MDQYNTPYYHDTSRNYSRQQTPFTNQYLYQDLSDNLRVSSPFSQDFYQTHSHQNLHNLKKQLHEQIKRHNVLLQQVTNLSYQNQQLRKNQYSNLNMPNTSSLRQENERLKEQIQRKKQQGNVPQHLIEQLSELRRENSWLRQNTANLNQKNNPKY